MARLCLPDSAVKGVDVEGARLGFSTSYNAGRDGTVTVDNPRHEKALRDLGAFSANLGGRTRGGWRCRSCGFAAFIKTCSRCGGDCERES